MKKSVFVVFFIALFSSLAVFAQTNSPNPTPTRQRVVVAAATPTPKKEVVVTNTLPSPTPTPIVAPKPTATPIQNPIPVDRPVTSTTLPQPQQIPTATQTVIAASPLRLTEIKSKLEEAKRQMSSRPLPTALTDSFMLTDVVRVAFYDYDTRQIDYVVVTKPAFLTRGGEVTVSSSAGKYVSVYTIRANGVNTPITVKGQNGKFHLPLMVQYPVERGGKFYEMAYYISTHPGIVTPEVVNTGKMYIHNTLEVAREKLRQKGISISPQVADIAERLAIVEHIDHQRFWTEYHLNLFNEVYALYALNEGQTYRYSVSSAGAGGMAQMIPSTYLMIRNRYYSVGLMPDFVEGMRNHVNAAQAMLLYMQMTWDDLVRSPTVFEALQNGWATPAELMSAGYNSNPAKLPGYIKRAGSGWKNLIPRETKIYLQINASMDKYVPMVKRTK